MTLITTINSVCDAVNIDRFDSVYGADDPAANTMFELAQQAGDEIARRADWRGLLVSGSLLSSGSPIPTDFQRFVPGGGIRSAAGEFIRPVTNSAQWRVVSAIASVQPYYFLDGSVVRVAPPAAGNGALLDYVSNRWVKDGIAWGSNLTKDDNTFAFPEKLMVKDIIWRWRRLKGMAYDDQLAEFEADLSQEIDADRGQS
ncbi:hypothetical protein ACQKKX_02390 [Neorhizobium sp. NPDC001467]|uniref:phage adaptor protein n=1 Tax=Neorhizobium sp. NPDC001467 TaxID=3390595 RepID=UPI003D06BF00